MKGSHKEHQPNHPAPDHAPGAGSDKQHPETPSDANERFQKQKKEHEDKHHKD